MKKLILTFCFVWGIVCLNAQTDTLSPKFDQLVQVPLSPEAAAFTKYGNIPVSLYTGVPQISVPIHQIQGRELSIPVSLSYDASGIKVDQLATWVGLGWNLNVGGVVTRQVAGLPDGYPATVSSTDPDSGYALRIFDNQMIEFLDYAAANNLSGGTVHPYSELERFFGIEQGLTKKNVDTQPDIFSFSVNGLSGTIFINYADSTAACVEHPNLKVQFDFNRNAAPWDCLPSWEITTEDGTVYRFAEQERTVHTFEFFNSYETTHEYTSAWYLTDILSANGKDDAQFSYTSSTDWVNPQPRLQQLSGLKQIASNHGINNANGYSCAASPPEPIMPTESIYLVRQFYLTNITLNGKLAASFYTGDDRADLKGRKTLSQANFFDLSGHRISKVDFSYSYFGNASYISGFNTPTDSTVLDTTILINGTQPVNFYHVTYTYPAFPGDSETKVRLKLDDVQFWGKSASTPKTYSFDYIDPTDIPDRNGTAVDFWGYYNGISNPHRVPSLALPDTTLGGANRNPNISFAEIGTLERLHYPTGGYTEFAYQAHEIPPTSSTYNKEVTEQLINTYGGTTSQDPYNVSSCWGPYTNIPVGSDAIFEISSADQPNRVEIEWTGSASPSAAGMEIIIYRAGNGCITLGSATLCDNGTLHDYCNWDTVSDTTFWDDPTTLTSNNYWDLDASSWAAGTYRIIAVNDDPNIHLSVRYIKTEVVPVTSMNQIGGLRTYKIVDKTDPSNTALTKYIYYSDISTVALASITPSLFSNPYSSSGVNHLPLRFDAESYSRSCNCVYSDNECTYVNRYSSNLNRQIGPHIAYTTVSELLYGDQDGFNGYSVHEYYNDPEFVSEIPFSKRNLLNGELKSTKVYDQDGIEVQETQNYFSRTPIGNASSRGIVMNSDRVFQSHRIVEIQSSQDCDPAGPTTCASYSYWGFCNPCTGQTPPQCSTEWCLGGMHSIYSALLNYVHSSYWARLDSSVQIEFFNGKALTSKSYQFYENPLHRQLTRSQTTNSNGDSLETRLYYPDDVDPLTAFSASEKSSIALLKKDSLHRINTPILTEKYVNGNKVFISKQSFQDLGIRPASNFGTPHLIGVDSLFNSRGLESELIPTVIFHNYDDYGNPVELSRKHGPSIVYLWGYNYSRPVAKIQNANLQEVLDALPGYNNLSDLSTIQDLTGSSLSTILNQLRTNSVLSTKAMVTTYTYADNGQVETITDPNGKEMSFEYDGHNRFYYSVDHQGNIRQKIVYNYSTN